jgi:hypothetical protein
MNTKAILSEVARLHERASAAPLKRIKINGARYNLAFNGRNWLASTEAGETIAEFNTRSATQAGAWLRDYLAN